jgi:hypothetical protein
MVYNYTNNYRFIQLQKMNIVEFNKKTDILTEKYAPNKINNIIGAKRQVALLIDWLNNYTKNATMNLEKKKKTGKKPRKQKAKKAKKTIIDTIDTDALNCGEDCMEDTVGDDIDCNDIDRNDIDGNDANEGSEGIDIIAEIEDKKKSKKREPEVCCCAIVTGDHGSGKTALVRAVLHDLGYLIKAVNFAKLESIKSVDEFIENLLTGDDVYETIAESSCKRGKAIIVDEIQSASTPKEKSVISGLLKLNSEIWGCPVIFIGSNKHKRIITGIKKECYQISLSQPGDDDMMRLFERVALGEGMTFENMDVITKIIEHGQNDYRRLIVTLGELYRIYEKETITTISITNYLKCISEKNMDKSIFDNTVHLFTRYNGINSTLKIFETDKSNMPLMVHQNHFSAINGYIKEKSKKIDISTELTKSLSHGDVVDNYIYSDQNWSLSETYGFYTCVYPSFKINQNIDTTRLTSDSKYSHYRPNFETLYPKDLNRTSTRRINYKNVKLANDFFSNMSIDDYVLAAKFIKNLLDDGRVEECEKMLKDYNLTAQGIMYVLKIDKINGTRKDVPRSIEKKVKEIAMEPIKASVITKPKK